MTKLPVFNRKNLMIAVNLFSLMCTIVLTIPSSDMLCTIALWTGHLVDFPATIAETVGQHCVWIVKKKPSALIFKFVWRANKQYFLALIKEKDIISLKIHQNEYIKLYDPVVLEILNLGNSRYSFANKTFLFGYHAMLLVHWQGKALSEQSNMSAMMGLHQLKCVVHDARRVV